MGVMVLAAIAAGIAIYMKMEFDTRLEAADAEGLEYTCKYPTAANDAAAIGAAVTEGVVGDAASSVETAVDLVSDANVTDIALEVRDAMEVN